MLSGMMFHSTADTIAQVPGIPSRYGVPVVHRQSFRNRQLMERYGFKPNEKVVLTVARMAAHEGYKGYDRVIEAFPAVRAACGPVRYPVNRRWG